MAKTVEPPLARLLLESPDLSAESVLSPQALEDGAERRMSRGVGADLVLCEWTPPGLQDPWP